MTINLREIRMSKSDSAAFSFEYIPEENPVDIPNVGIKGAISVSGTVTLTGRASAYVEADIKYVLAGECTNCLKPFEREFSAELDQEFSQDNEYGYTVKGDAIILDKAVMDEVILSLPVNFVCGEDCDFNLQTEF